MKKVLWIIFILVTLQVSAKTQKKIVEPSTIQPKLVLAIVVDQFRYDYLLRFRSDYKEGLGQLLSRGAVFINARYDHFPTFTSVGHAVLMTGASPGVSGIVGNEWYDRESGKIVRSASDESAQLLGGAGGPGPSPRNLLVSTVGDEMKMASGGRARVIGISLKDYSAILAAGHMADGVYWFDGKTGNFASSTYYFADLPEWVKAFNAMRAADRYKGRKWLGSKLPAETGPKLYRALESSPWGNELVEEMAEKAVEAEQMGRHSVTDLLVLSFSSNDFVGHQFGPDSAQVRDTAIATDKILGKLFKFIDSYVGLSNVIVVFTADHGVAPIPEVNASRKMPGGRLSFDVVQKAVQKALNEKYGEGKWIAGTPEEMIYLNWDLIVAKKLSTVEVEQEAARAILAIPHVFRVYTWEQLTNGGVEEDLAGRRVINGFSPHRSADLYVLLEPYWLFGRMNTTHGTAFGYDTHVPLIFMGPGIKAGRFYGSVAINDVAPTLSAILEIETPSGSDGRILSEILAAR